MRNISIIASFCLLLISASSCKKDKNNEPAFRYVPTSIVFVGADGARTVHKSFTYEGNRITEIISSDGEKILLNYNSKRQVVSVVEEGSTDTVTLEYDSNGEIIRFNKDDITFRNNSYIDGDDIIVVDNDNDIISYNTLGLSFTYTDKKGIMYDVHDTGFLKIFLQIIQPELSFLYTKKAMEKITRPDRSLAYIYTFDANGYPITCTSATATTTIEIAYKAIPK